MAYIGRLSPEKGVSDLLEAMAILRNRRLDGSAGMPRPTEIREFPQGRANRPGEPQLTRPAEIQAFSQGRANRPGEPRLIPLLLIVGDGRQRAELVRLAETLGLQDRIRWAGMRPNHELAPYFGAADIACVPSHMEGVPNAALEALACGIPVVGTRVGGIPEVLTDATGRLVEPGKPRQLAEALANALDREWDRSSIVAHSQQFSWDVNARTLYDLLEKVVFHHPPEEPTPGPSREGSGRRKAHWSSPPWRG